MMGSGGQRMGTGLVMRPRSTKTLFGAHRPLIATRSSVRV